MQIQSVGIDIAKAKFDVAFLNMDGSCTKSMYENSKVGISGLISELKKQRTADTVPCVLESTGHYHFPVALMLTKAGFKVNCINPLITKRYQRASIRNAKSDSIDALRLAEVGIYEKNLLQFTANTRAINLKRIVSYVNSLETIHQKMRASIECFREMKKVTGLTVNLTHAEKAMEQIKKQIELLIDGAVEITPEDGLLVADQTDGVSREKLSVLLAILSDKIFPNRDALVAYVGLDVSVRQSGTWKGQGKISKRGNAYARKILFQMAWGLKQHNQRYRQRYDELRKKGKDYRTTMLILARTFLRYLFAQYFRPKIKQIA